MGVVVVVGGGACCVEGVDTYSEEAGGEGWQGSGRGRGRRGREIRRALCFCLWVGAGGGWSSQTVKVLWGCSLGKVREKIRVTQLYSNTTDTSIYTGNCERLYDMNNHEEITDCLILDR